MPLLFLRQQNVKRNFYHHTQPALYPSLPLWQFGINQTKHTSIHGVSPQKAIASVSPCVLLSPLKAIHGLLIQKPFVKSYLFYCLLTADHFIGSYVDRHAVLSVRLCGISLSFSSFRSFMRRAKNTLT